MTTDFELPSGATAKLRDPRLVTERHRRPIDFKRQEMQQLSPEWVTELSAAIRDARAAEEANLPAPEIDMAALNSKLTVSGLQAAEELNDLIVVALVESWSFDFPVTSDTVLDLPHDDLRSLHAKCAEVGKALFLSTDPDPDPESPTQPSSV
jgi:hypothetical protein